MRLKSQVSQKKARQWLSHRGLKNIKLTPLLGYSNHVFKVAATATPQQSDKQRRAQCEYSVIRLANPDLSASLCPLNQQAGSVIGKHQQAAQLGLAPELLDFDIEKKIMWLAYAGTQRPMSTPDITVIAQYLRMLYDSDIQWNNTPLPSPQETDVIGLSILEQIQNPPRQQAETLAILPRLAAYLIQLAKQRGYRDYPAVPVHSDLNPGNCLHDHSRWWFIDWDFATTRAREWDVASLIVEHGWYREQQAQISMLQKALAIHPQDLNWFCCNFALSSYQWHQQRHSSHAVLKEKYRLLCYWALQAGFHETLL